MGPYGMLALLMIIHYYPPHRFSAHQMEEDLQHGEIEWVVELWISETRALKNLIHLDILALLERH